MALISVVIPTLGVGDLPADALTSLGRERRRGAELEVILVAPSEVLERLDTRSESIDRTVDTGPPRGFAEATNRGLEAARGEIVGVLNDDAVVEPGWCARLVEELDAHPDAAAVQGVNLQLHRPDRVDGAGIAWNRSWQAVQIDRDGAVPDPTEPSHEIFAVSATAALYRRRALDDVGPFDTRLESYYEDVDLGVRLRAAGWTARTVPAARCFHAGSTTGSARPVQRLRLLYGNRWLVLARLLGREFPRRAPKILVRDLRDVASAVPKLDGPRAAGVLLGWARAVRRLPAWMHRGGPRVPLSELDRFRVSS